MVLAQLDSGIRQPRHVSFPVSPLFVSLLAFSPPPFGGCLLPSTYLFVGGGLGFIIQFILMDISYAHASVSSALLWLLPRALCVMFSIHAEKQKEKIGKKKSEEKLNILRITRRKRKVA